MLRDERAILVIDCQVDFCEGGSLAVEGGAQVATNITTFLEERANDLYGTIIFTKDWHIKPGSHWVSDGQEPNFVDTWPVHCAAGTTGAALHPNLHLPIRSTEVHKGHYEAAYSGFEGKTLLGETLDQFLKNSNIRQVDVVGIATDFCVAATAWDAYDGGYDVRVLADLTAAVDPGKVPDLCRAFEEAGLEVIESSYV